MAQDVDTKYFERVLTLVPEKYDAEHPSVVYFCILALAILSAKARSDILAENEESTAELDKGQTSSLNAKKHKAIKVFSDLVPSVIKYIRSMFTGCGFRAACYGIEEPHVLATYFCLATAAMIKHEFKDAEKQAMVAFINRCRSKGGMYCLTEKETQFEVPALVSLRITYAAFSSLALLGEPVSDSETVEYIKSLQNYDGGFGETRYDESHAGLTFCALACLDIANALDAETKTRAARFLLRRQIDSNLYAFNGRPGKEPDCCYTFWVLSSLRIVEINFDTNNVQTSAFLKSCYDPILKAYGPVPDSEPDAYHTALVLAAQNPDIVDKSLVVARGC